MTSSTSASSTVPEKPLAVRRSMSLLLIMRRTSAVRRSLPLMAWVSRSLRSRSRAIAVPPSRAGFPPGLDGREHAGGSQGKRGERQLGMGERVADGVGQRGAEPGVAALAQATQAERVRGGPHLLVEALDGWHVGRRGEAVL